MTLSLRHGSFFAKNRLPCSKIMHLSYMWMKRDSSRSIGIGSGCSNKTVTAFTHYFRQLVSESLDPEDDQIGGEGIIVELEESKCGKRNYNKGHRMEGTWVVGGVERTEARRIFLVLVEKRGTSTLLQVI